MKLPEQPLLPANPDTDYARRSAVVLQDLLGRAFRKVNALASGRASATDDASTGSPTAGLWAQGDFVRNSAPQEQGAAGGRYVITGWLCLAGGEPGTWVEQRVLTGN